LRRLITTALLAALVAVSASIGRAATPVPPPLDSLFGGAFELVNQDGMTVTDRDFRGRFMLIYFGYTFCPDICPYSLQTMTEALESVAPEDTKKVQPIFVTIDPARDTPEFLKKYVALYGENLIGLSGSEAQIRVAAKAYRIHRRKVIPADLEDKNDYFVDHSSLIYLMSPDGKFLTFFPYDTDAVTMATTITKYVSGVETAAE